MLSSQDQISKEYDINERNASQNKQRSNKPGQIGTMVNRRSNLKPQSIDQVINKKSCQIGIVNKTSNSQPVSIESVITTNQVSKDILEETSKNSHQDFNTAINGQFILDSAAVTSTVNSDNFQFEQTENNLSNQLAILANGNTIPILKKGKLKIGDNSIDCIQIGTDAPNLLSIPQLTKIGYTVIFHEDIVLLLPPIHTITNEIQSALKHWSRKWEKYAIKIQQENGLYSLDVTKSGELKSAIKSIYCDNTPNNKCNSRNCHHACLVNVNKINLQMPEPPKNLLFNLHCAFGHISVKNLLQLGIRLTDEDQLHIKHCLTCLSIKHKMKPTTKLKDRNTTQVFQKLHMDTAGPFSVGSKKWWVVLIIDEYSRYIHTIITDSYGNINGLINSWLCEQHIHHHRQPELITTDKGSEFKNIEYLLPEAYGNKGYQPLIRPLINYAPTGNKQWNGLAERAVQSIKLLQQLITAHLPKELQQKYIVKSFEYAAFVYNHLPHSTIGYDQPYGRYFFRPTGKEEMLTDEQKQNRFMFIDSFPARLFNGDTYTLPNLPMFLEDVEFFISKDYKPVANKGFFIGYTEFHQYQIHDSYNSKEHIVSDITRLYSFQLANKKPLRLANEPILPIYFNGINTTIPQKIPTSFNKAETDINWIPANKKEIDSFLKYNVFEPIQTEDIPKTAVLLHTFWLFTLKHPTNQPKSRLITINREWVGVKNKEAYSPVASQLSSFFTFFEFAHSKDTRFFTYDIATAFLNAHVPESEFYYLHTPQGFRGHFKTKFVRLRRYAYGLNTSPKAFYETLSRTLTKLYQKSLVDPCLYRSSEYDEFMVQHVDDLLLLTKNPKPAEELLSGEYTLKINKDPDYYLGYTVMQTDKTIKINGQHYIEQCIFSFDEDDQRFILQGTHNNVQIDIATANKPVSPYQSNFPLPNQSHATYLRNHLLHYDLQTQYSKKFSDNIHSTKEPDYELPPMNLSQIDVDTVIPPSTNDVHRRKDFLKEIQRTVSNTDYKQRYAKLESLVLQYRYQNDYTNFIKKHPFPHKTFSLRKYQKLVGIITYIAHKYRFDIQVQASFLSQFNTMPTLLQYYQALQLLKYLYTTRYSCYRFFKLPILSDRNAATHISNQHILIEVFTDASYTSSVSQCGYLILIDGMFIKSKSYRLQNGIGGCSFDVELFALRIGLHASLGVKSTLYDFGYHDVDIKLRCDNLPVVDVVLGRNHLEDRMPEHIHCLNYLQNKLKRGDFTLEHIPGALNPADILTKTLSNKTLTNLLTGPYLSSAFEYHIQPHSCKQHQL